VTSAVTDQRFFPGGIGVDEPLILRFEVAGPAGGFAALGFFASLLLRI